VFDNQEFKKLEMPILLLIGESEILYESKSAVERAWQLIPHIEADIVPNAGHMLTTDQPEEVTRRVMSFLRK
jgi:pimeloyl-ACP methyl ester carboxylesterase